MSIRKSAASTASTALGVFVGTALNNTNAVHDVNADIGRNAEHLRFYITDLASSTSVTMEILQVGGGTYETAFSVLAFEDPNVFELDGVSIDSVRITNGSAVDLDYVLLAW
jgi:hypothetical protein